MSFWQTREVFNLEKYQSEKGPREFNREIAYEISTIQIKRNQQFETAFAFGMRKVFKDAENS